VSDVLVLDGLTHDRLTAVLQRKGYLPRGRVERVAIESSRTTLISTIARLRLEYSPDAEGPRPSRLFFKASRPDHSVELAAAVLKEVAFYETVAASMRPGIVPHCYDAARDQTTSTFHLLLEDLAETHVVVTEWPPRGSSRPTHSSMRYGGTTRSLASRSAASLTMLPLDNGASITKRGSRLSWIG
jgi:hypothetical protein